ncbi:MAG: efflux RND transporter periplasmic adaptor subunit [Bacteroidia bacterium]|nr:efflux RND transporter periplasmic adaptor subunit [Bacteroidia bacterium]
MKARQIIIIAVAAVILLGAKLLSDKLAEPKEKAPRKTTSSVTTVFTETVKNNAVPVKIESTGLLEAVNRMELFSEVQGLMLADNGRFKAGNTFSKGQVLINVRADEQRASVTAQRSAFQRTISAVLPDLKLDYTDEFNTWQAYLQNFNASNTLPDLPEVSSEKLKLFLTGRNIYSEYFAVKNAEILLSKYRILAPYNGVLVQAAADPGTVIRPGQPLGVFIQPGTYELEVSVNATAINALKTGQAVTLYVEGNADKKWTGKISRVNSSIDPESQMSQVFVRVTSKELKDGMFLQAEIQGKAIDNAFELPRAVLLNDNRVYIVKDDVLMMHDIQAMHFSEKTVIVKGLEDGMQVITKMPPSAFSGMQVEIYQEK